MAKLLEMEWPHLHQSTSLGSLQVSLGAQNLLLVPTAFLGHGDTHQTVLHLFLAQEVGGGHVDLRRVSGVNSPFALLHHEVVDLCRDSLVPLADV